MKKILYTISIIGLICPAYAQNTQTKKSKLQLEQEKIYKQNFVAACLEEMGDLDKDLSEKYCSCAAEKILTKFTIEEIEALMLAMEQNETAVETFDKTIEPCIKQFEQLLSNEEL